MASKQTLAVEIHDHFRKAIILDGYAMEHASETLKYALQVGEELLAAKALIPHGGWVDACKRLFEPSLRKAEGYMRLSRNMNALPKSQKAAILFLENTLEGAAKAAKKAAKPDPPKPKPDEPADEPVYDELHYDEVDESIDAEFEPADEPEEPEEEAPPAKPDYGKCPVCAGVKWTEDDDGHVVCAKCHHPHGEPAGDVDKDRISTQRQKTVKTLEAAMRAFDDLQTMLAKPGHDGAIKSCKKLIETAKGWK